MPSIAVINGDIIGDWRGDGEAKRLLLYFDQLAVLNLETEIASLEMDDYPGELKWAKELEMLRDQGLVFDPLVSPGLIRLEDISHDPDLSRAMAYAAERQAHHASSKPSPAEINIHERFSESRNPAIRSWYLQNCMLYYLGRHVAGELRRQSSDAVAADEAPVDIVGKPSADSAANIAHVILRALPVPEIETPWQQLIEFRQDSHARMMLLDLRNWARQLIKGDTGPIEAAEKLEWLKNSYEQHMKLHRMKFERGVIETLVTTLAEVAEDVVTFKWSKAAQALFSIRKADTHLLEEEGKAPGREVAYVIRTWDQFRK